jgi:VWFA-related protein
MIRPQANSAVSIGLALACVFGAAAPAGRVQDAKQPIRVMFSVRDPSGHFIRNLRRENFVVYEHGVPVRDLKVDIEHAPVTLSVLLEGGGRYQQLNKILGNEIPYVGHPLLDALGSGDKVGVFSYASVIRTLVDFTDPGDALRDVFDHAQIPGFSESNFYDALIEAQQRTRQMPGRKAVLVITTGIDTFSRATFDDARAAAERSGVPLYCVGLAGLVQRTVTGTEGPLTKIDWSRANSHLDTLAKISGGRSYLRDPDLEIVAIYDDIMEHLRVRYVITYVPSITAGNDRSTECASRSSRPERASRSRRASATRKSALPESRNQESGELRSGRRTASTGQDASRTTLSAVLLSGTGRNPL